MAEQSSVVYQPVTGKEEGPRETGQSGTSMYKPRDPIWWYITGMTVYAFGSVGVVAWTLAGPSMQSGDRVLRTGSLKVNQFYSGLALSALLAPAGIMIRRISNDLALLQPFAIASKTFITLADFDLMMDPGMRAIKAMSTYSIILASVQAILMIAGAGLVPIGTLLVTTGEYSNQVNSTSLVGMPTWYQQSAMMTMSIEMGIPDCYAQRPDYPPCLPDFTGNFFLSGLSEWFQGTLVRQFGVLDSTNHHLGPTATSNISYDEGVKYDGIVSYTWNSGCKASNVITYNVTTLDGVWRVIFTRPDGLWDYQLGSEDAFLQVYNDASLWNPDMTIPWGGTTYFSAAYPLNQTAALPNNTDGIDFVDGGWISRVECSPTLEWQVSSCTYRRGTMTDCVAAPGTNTTELDVLGMGALAKFMTALLYSIHQKAEWAFGMDSLVLSLMFDPKAPIGLKFRAPGLDDYHNMYGLVAQAVTAVSTNGYYGASYVPITGSPPRPVYVIRTQILAIIVFILIIVPLMTTLNLLSNKSQHLPIRRTTFLTVANAVRGAWWDTTLSGGCVLSPQDLRNRHRDKVMFGVDVQHPRHVGLAPEVRAVSDHVKYSGISPEKEGSR